MINGVSAVVVLVGVFQFEPAALRKVNLVGSQGKLTANNAPDLHIDLGAVKSSFIRDLHIRDIRFNQVPGEPFPRFPSTVPVR